MIRDTDRGVELLVRVIPRARRTEPAGQREGHLLIRLAAPPVDGAANEALIDFLSRQLQCPRRAIHIVSGETSRTKRVAIDGVTSQLATLKLQK